MTRLELKLLYKKETGMRPFIDNGMRQIKPVDNYRIYQDYVHWLEEELMQLKELKQKLIPWEPLGNMTDKQIFDNH